jgi:putative photosynthetic complex assembly protein 2
MNEAMAPVAFAVFSWWIGTGLVFVAERLVRNRAQSAITTIFASGAVSLFCVLQSSLTTEPWGAYLGFAGSIGLWGALELSFLSGLVTGPRRAPSPTGTGMGRRFGQAVMALLYHELALIVCGLVVVAICWHQPNPTAACTYTLLWIMRESAKLNLFLGVRNTAVELLPKRLAHLASYFGTRKLNWLLPVSILGAAIADAVLVRQAISAVVSPQQNVAGFLLATLLGLAIIEHIVLVLPIRADALWIWATRRGGKIAPPGDARCARLRGEPEVVPARSAPVVL